MQLWKQYGLSQIKNTNHTPNFDVSFVLFGLLRKANAEINYPSKGD
ncbi:hypothetical protein BH11BAC5_BH11BAC5_43880 [soil metagenome]